MSVETAPLQGITLYSHADDFRSHWIRYVLAEKQIKYHLIMVDEDDEDLASLNPYNQLPMLIENELKLFNTGIISEYLDDRYRQNKLYADAPMPRSGAETTKSRTLPGVRCAEATTTSDSIPNCFKSSTAGFNIGQSESLPITMATFMNRSSPANL